MRESRFLGELDARLQRDVPEPECAEVDADQGAFVDVEAARSGAFASDSILPIVGEFENPRHEAFKERTAWSLYNACTERMKAQSASRQVDGFKALNQVLVELN